MAGGAIRAEIWLAIICEHSTKAVIAEVNYSERQKIEVEMLLGAANDDGGFGVAGETVSSPFALEVGAGRSSLSH